MGALSWKKGCHIIIHIIQFIHQQTVPNTSANNTGNSKYIPPPPRPHHTPTLWPKFSRSTDMGIDEFLYLWIR